MKRIKDILPLDGALSLFDALDELDPPWQGEADNGTLDLMYLTHSGQKICGPIFDLVAVDGDIEDQGLAKIAAALYTRYKNKWSRLWQVEQAEYEPLENYTMTEHGELNANGNTHTDTEGKQVTESESQTESTATATDNAGRYGFASTSPVNTDTGTTTSTSTGSTGGNGTVTDENKTDTTDTRQTLHDLTRSGNIGIRSSQELLTQELELWKWTFFENVFEDIDKAITLAVY